MSDIRVEADRTLDAPAEVVYQFLKDYRVKHPSVLPPAFHDYVVEKGGEGEGTVFRVSVRTAGSDRHYHMRVSEPTPGSVLQEKDLVNTMTTTFTVSPLDGGNRSTLRIASHWTVGGGIAGFLERAFAPGVTRRLYVDELDRLAAAVRR
jgi:hypothetical protein